ncbi:UDP-N-acetylmuramoyl-L-alanyl-D-glutamate--2,6-diaminopimelate ligase [Bauldia litoralis]|uniref:UDP-N-acetylmuramoyl-L-alanyl-D-glutamate--2,6-diaminopimelate ligase n=1 Tax=Bauldia litoralis TaxID=665467 RepID=A0A1G6D342_9HYPH|nr:UDP-N-acetylmuramoyl-L-alanyl-D-glutamate--2,6-diaminopimelate ligase [Bauldia litoralis]SDB39602.1 UDP-N-acetylmuramoylalanyl-D-glutamate--2,6-diaminopimelate ligase [Bauldia litoralis]
MLLGDLTANDLTIDTGTAAIDITGIASDSRAVGRGFLFAALPGSTTDGARFVDMAIAAGAVAVLAGTGADIPSLPGVAVLRADDPRHILALMASRLHPRQPDKLVAVTGTSGKTSVATFAREIFATAGHEAASLGTIGIASRRWSTYGRLTTPDPIALHEALDRLAGEGVTHAALEASSHGLDQRRLDGIRIAAAGFTNLGRDHMDYHPTVADYLAAKLRLFTAILPADGTAVVDMDGAHAVDALAAAEARGARLIRIGRQGAEIRITGLEASGFRQRLRFDGFGKPYDVLLPLAGAFQASNALVAAGLAIGAGIAPETAFGALAGLEGATGRLELAGRKANGALVFVDYAHKPDAIATVLQALRPMTAGRLVIVFGAGGDRDPGKRRLMGEAASAHADVVVVTDDNPRSEAPASIRKAILEGAPGAIEIGDRGKAISEAMAMLGPGDVLCVAGKGHETGQIVGAEELPFSDHQVVRSVLAAEEAA